MSLIVFDNFDTNQANNTVSNAGTWSPATATRETIGLNGASSFMTLGTWRPGSPGGFEPARLHYDYVAPIDFQALVGSIILQGVSFAGGIPAIMTLELFDGAVTQGVPSTLVAGTVTWDVTDFNLVDLTNIEGIRFIFALGGPFTGQVETLTSTLVCVARDTQILMADFTLMNVQDLKRGDLVQGHDNQSHKIARVLHSMCPPNYMIDLVKMEKNALGLGKPNRDTLISGWHPILYRGIRKPAKCFQNYPGITHWYHTIEASEVLPLDDNRNTYSLFNLQFDHEVMFNANGLDVQAVSPHSRLMPLPKHLFFDETLEDKPLVSESYIIDTQWDDTILE